MAMAGRQPEQGEGIREAGSFGGLDHFLRRLDSNDVAEPVGAGPGATSQAQAQAQASPSNSIAALVSNYDALSPNPANPWQYLSVSNPTSPTSQREYYNHLSAHTSSGGYFQRDLATEWNMLEELEQQRAVSQAQSAMASRAPTMNHQHSLHPVQRRANHPDGTPDQNGAEHSEANFMYEEAAAAAAWYRSGGYLRGPDAASQALYESLARLDTQTSDSAQLDGEARMRSWERAITSQYFAAGEMVHDEPWPSRAPPSSEAGGSQAGCASRSVNSILTPSNTSQSSGSNGDDSDEEECTRIGLASGDGNSSGKRKTPEPSGEDGNDSARTSSEAELKKTVASLPSRRLSFRKPREPRYAIKTRTDVDIMDDGFKWRKYGQKAVKNSPHPRNYYRCTTPQCPVRKRVERSHEDSGLVITTYEGTHTHQTPGFRGPAPQFSERPPRNLFFNPGPLGPAGFAPRFPFPPEFSRAALHQLRALQQAARTMAAQHQIPPGPAFPASNAQRESIRRAQQFLGLHDPTFGAVKQEPFYDFMAQLRGGPNLPFPGRNFQPPAGGASFLDRMRQHQMRGPSPPPPPPPPRHLPPMPDLDYPDFPQPPTDTDLVRRVLEAEDGDHGPNTDANADNDGSPGQSFASQIQSSLRSRVELERRMSQQRSSQSSGPGLMRRRGSSDTLASTSSQRRLPRASDDDSLVDGLLQEMAQPNASR